MKRKLNFADDEAAAEPIILADPPPAAPDGESSEPDGDMPTSSDGKLRFPKEEKRKAREQAKTKKLDKKVSKAEAERGKYDKYR